MRKQRGMTLLETLIVVGIAVAVIGGIVFMMQRQAERERSEDAVRMQGQEMANLAKAARAYANTVGEDWADGARVVVAIDDLVDEGLLPEGFGARVSPTDLGVTPIGQQYAVISIKDGAPYDDDAVEDGTIRTVILDLGTPNPGRLERAGVPNIEERILAHKESVALYTAREDRIPMGVLEATDDMVRGVGRVFTKDVLDWIENVPTTAAAVALVGFPDLDPAGSNPNPTPGGPGLYADCQVVGAHEGCGGLGCNPYTPPVCPSGWDELARPRLCGAGGTEVTSTDVGVLVSSFRTDTSQSGFNVGLTCTLYRGSITSAVAMLNGAQIYERACSATQLTSAFNFDEPPVCQSTTTSGSVPDQLNVDGNPNAYGLLCCLPRED
jgi:type II secretory pathway pseudopilin PulG